MKEKFERFILEFKNRYDYLIKDGGARFDYEIEENELTIYCSVLFKADIDLISYNFGNDWLLSTGVLNRRDLILIKIKPR